MYLSTGGGGMLCPESVKSRTLRRDEHDEEPEDTADDAAREAKLKGRWGWVWKVFYAVV